MGSSLLLTHLHEKKLQKTIIFSFTENQLGFNGSELTTKGKVGGESRADLTPGPSPKSEIPNQVYQGQFYSISKTDEELSAVCPSSVFLNSEKSDAGWACIKVLGPLEFSLTGILADISHLLAKAEIRKSSGCKKSITTG